MSWSQSSSASCPSGGIAYTVRSGRRPSPGGLCGLDPPGRLELLDGPVEGTHLALGIVLAPLMYQPLHLVRVKGPLGEQGERGQSDGPLRWPSYARRHIAYQGPARRHRLERLGGEPAGGGGAGSDLPDRRAAGRGRGEISV